MIYTYTHTFRISTSIFSPPFFSHILVAFFGGSNRSRRQVMGLEPPALLVTSWDPGAIHPVSHPPSPCPSFPIPHRNAFPSKHLKPRTSSTIHSQNPQVADCLFNYNLIIFSVSWEPKFSPDIPLLFPLHQLVTVATLVIRHQIPMKHIWTDYVISWNSDEIVIIWLIYLL